MTTKQWVKEARYVGVRELRENLAKVVKSRHFFFVTDHGKPVKAMVPYEVLLELIDVLDELKDKTLIEEVKRGREEYRAGGWVPVSRLKKAFSK